MKKLKKMAKKRRAKKKVLRRLNKPKIRPRKQGKVKIVRDKNKKKNKRVVKKPSRKRIKPAKIKAKTKSVKAKPVIKKPLYTLNTDFGSFFELRDLILKSLPAEKDTMTERINKLGKVKLAVISGVFMNKENNDPYIPDLLIVGDDLDKRKLRSFLKAIEAEIGKEIKFVILDKEEFQYRLAMFDRFIRVLLESPHEKLINRLGI